MTDTQAASQPAATASANAQTIVSMAIVGALSLIAVLSIVAALLDGTIAAVAFGAVGVVVGSLATALNAPSGIGNVIAQARKDPTNAD